MVMGCLASDHAWREGVVVSATVRRFPKTVHCSPCQFAGNSKRGTGRCRATGCGTPRQDGDAPRHRQGWSAEQNEGKARNRIDDQRVSCESDLVPYACSQVETAGLARNIVSSLFLEMGDSHEEL